MGHGGFGRRPVPVLFAGREPDDIAGAYLLDGSALALHAATAGDDDQSLPERMRVPGGAGARLEGDLRALHPRGIEGIEERIDADRAGEPVRRAFAGRPAAGAKNVHGWVSFNMPSVRRRGSDRRIGACRAK